MPITVSFIGVSSYRMAGCVHLFWGEVQSTGLNGVLSDNEQVGIAVCRGDAHPAGAWIHTGVIDFDVRVEVFRNGLGEGCRNERMSYGQGAFHPVRPHTS